MGNKLYGGNLPFSGTEDSLQQWFSQSGTVESATISTDPDTGRSYVVGFVEMSSGDASRAMQALNGADFGGRPLKVNEAQDRAARRA